MTSYWRTKATPIIRGVLVAHAGEPGRDVRRALRLAYPFGERRHWPYKVWLDEIRRQTGKLPPLRTTNEKIWAVDPRQLPLPEVQL